MTDMDGKLGRYACRYEFEGQTHCFDIPAVSQNEANRKMVALKQTAKVDGRIYFRLSLPAPLMYLAMPFLWVAFHVFAFFKGPPRDV